MGSTMTSTAARRVLWAVLLAASAIGCGGSERPRPDVARPLRVEWVQRACLQAPPPIPAEGADEIIVGGARVGDNGIVCPIEYDGCLTRRAALGLDQYLRAADRWMRLAWIGCGPLDRKDPDDDATP